MLGTLLFSIVAGVPIGIIADKKLKQLQQDYNTKKELQDLLKDNEIPLIVKYAYTVDSGIIAELEGSYPVYKLNIMQSIFNNHYKSLEVEFVKVGGSIRLKVITKIEDKTEPYRYINLSPYELLVGYSDNGIIKANMVNCPHLLVTGLSGQGKTGMLKVMLSNLKGADVVLMNGFEEDFKEFRDIRKIKGEKDILLFLSSIYENLYKRERPLYIVIEELATIKDKKLNNIIQELLCVARHYNIFIIGIIQIATKEQLQFKDYFNSRCTFKQLNDSSYKVALGVTPESGLKKREFYLYTDDLYKGTTFTL